MTSLNTNNITKFVFLFLIIIIPFSISDYGDSVKPEKITSDLRFYEINTCSISLNEFLLENPNVIYQDHYKIRFNNYSSIRCFGQITGIDQIGYTFYISIGTNTLVNIFLQSLFWLLAISLLPKKNNYQYSHRRIISSISVSAILSVLIYSEFRYYQRSIFEIDLSIYDAYKYIFVYLFLIIFLSSVILESRNKKIINHFPYIYLFIGVFSGTNIYFWFLPLTVYGVESLFKQKKIRRLFNIFNLLILFWSYQSIGENFYLKPDKIRGLSLTSNNFLTTYVWSYLIIFTIIGVFIFVRNTRAELDYTKLCKNFLVTGLFILSLGYLGSSMPYINFINYYFFGQTKYGTDNQNIFQNNVWGETIAWRGFFPSAETIGEFFSLSILLFLIVWIKNKKDLNYYYLFLPFAGFGLYLSNNKAATFLLVLSSLLIIFKYFKINNFYKYSFSIGAFLLLIYFVRIENLFFSFEFTRDKILDMAYLYGYDYKRSIAYTTLSQIKLDSNFIYLIISLLSQIAFFINRSELWGLFVARYNPSSEELLFGTGPYSLAKLYGEINISSIRVNTDSQLGFLLPHSSLLLILIFTGLVGVVAILLMLSIKLKKTKNINYDNYILISFLVINLIKSDSILYFSSLFTIIFFLNIDKYKFYKNN